MPIRFVLVNVVLFSVVNFNLSLSSPEPTFSNIFLSLDIFFIVSGISTENSFNFTTEDPIS
jgi:hypothetical protein